MAEGEGGGIFVSYRRQETSHLAGRLSDRLADRFGEGQVFIDVDTIGPGVDFAGEISRAVAACKVLLAVIGPDWLSATDRRGRRRLDDPDDIVRLEIEAALARGVLVIPILAEAAVMPDREDLPDSLASLARHNALRVRHESFRYDSGLLVTAIEQVLASVAGTDAAHQLPPVPKPGVPAIAHDVPSAGSASNEAAPMEAEAARDLDRGESFAPGAAEPVTPRFNGLYVREVSEAYSMYLRFFPSGKVCSVSAPGSAEEVSAWLSPDNRNLGVGDVSIIGAQISFREKSRQGIIEYNGVISADSMELHLDVHSYINGNEYSGIWRFEQTGDPVSTPRQTKSRRRWRS
jgi:hypothetical protein